MTVRAWWLKDGTTLSDNRLGLSGLFMPSSGLGVASGVLSPVPFAVTQEATASVNVLVPAFRGVVQSAASGIDGAFVVTSDASATVNVLGGAGAPATSPRNDLIVLQTSADTDATHGNAATLAVVRGAANATPVDPATPAGALPLARVRIKAASAYGGSPTVVNADIDQLAAYTALRGGDLRVPSQVNLPASAQAWQRARALDTGQTYEWNGTAWVVPASQAAWTPYTPIWRNGVGGAGLSIGNGTLAGAYILIGKTCHFRIDWLRGTTTQAGTTTYTWSLPVAPKAGRRSTGNFTYSYSSRLYPGSWYVEPGSTELQAITVDGYWLSNTRPGTWGATDAAYIAGTYETA